MDIKLSGLFKSVIVLTVALLTGSPVTADEVRSGEFTKLLNGLVEANYSEKTTLVESLAALKDERVLPVLVAMLNSKLYFIDENKKIAIAEEADSKYKLTDAITGDTLGVYGDDSVEKINTNNSLRGALRGLVAEINLSSDNVNTRIHAAQDVVSNIDEEGAARLSKLLPKESNKRVRELMQLGIAMSDAGSSEKVRQLSAIALLETSLLPEARNVLNNVLSGSEDIQIKRAAQGALKQIESRLKFYSFVETTFFGISLGTVLLLIAVGLAITFGVMGVINMAHGELMMLGAYTTYVTQKLMPNYIDISLFIAIPSAFVVAGTVGIIIERGVIRFLYGRPLETLLATFGISLVLQQIVRSIFSPLNRAVETPSWMSGSLEINGALSLTYNRLYIIVFALLVFTGLLLILKKTRLGLQVRAVAQNRDMARAMGVRTEWVDAMTFGLGSGIAGVAGVALSQLTNVGPNLGQGYIVDSFMVVVFGGVGNLLGTLVGAISLGVFNKYLEPWTGAVLAKIFVLVFIILFIQKRPRGLFPQKGRSAEN